MNCLHPLHMDLFGLVTPRSINHEKYTLVIVDEYSRYTWVYFLKKKIHAPETIMSFIKRVENKNDIKVKQLRTDNGSVFSKQYWNETVATACYTQNRSTIVKRHLKTPYEIFWGRILNIDLLYVFGCPVYIHKHKDYLGKFDEKADDENDIPNNNPPEHSNHNNDSPIIENIINDEVVQDSKPTSSLVEDALAQNSILISNIPSSSIPSTISLVAQDRWSQDKYIELVNIIGDPGAGMLTRAMAKTLSATLAHECLFVDFLSEEEPKKVSEALKHPGWVDAMQDELNQFARNKVWTLVPTPYINFTVMKLELSSKTRQDL
ncbi:retrovirus-related pol polyprotein from transposon TNT 1-94 [Tanacetum coccineum]